LIKKALITGCEGFIGSYLAELLIKNNFEVHGTVRGSTQHIDHLGDKLKIYGCNISEKNKISEIVNKVIPDFVFHLAAQSLISESWRDPVLTFEVNMLGTINLLESIKSAGINPVIEIVCSSDEYGDSRDGLIKESAQLSPSSPYGVSKLAADMLGKIYWQNYRLRTICVRPFSIIGPKKVGDACSDFARGILAVESGKQAILEVGNVEPVRDFVDVRDAVRAMLLLVETGQPGEAYNICSGKGITIKYILDTMIAFSKCRVPLRQEPHRIRNIDKPSQVGDCSKLSSLGWKPLIPLEQTLADILNYWRART
jgi:GDP-4-dehydro-6-deoxy-D-mannose reductase